MQTRQQLEAILRALLPQLAAQYHVRWLGYFGSFATGQPGPDSDIDIMAEFSEPLGWEFFELEELLKLFRKSKERHAEPVEASLPLRRSYSTKR